MEADRALREGMAALQAGNERRAVSLFQQVIAEHPDSEQAAYCQAVLLARRGQVEQALAAARLCLQKYVGSEPALELIALLEGQRERPPWVPGQSIAEEFVVERELGQGGMGNVYLVKSQLSGQRFAVKRLSAVSGETQRRVLLNELQAWIDLPPHPHLVRCHFFRTIEDQLAIFAEYVDGGPLSEWLRRKRLVRLEAVLDVAIQLCWGLHAAHEMGLVHQDVKPDNVLLTRDGVVKITDFGLARMRRLLALSATGRPSTLVSAAGMMTQAYCSPEQARRLPLSRKTDMWSFAVSMLEMFTGEVSWITGAVAPEVLEDHLQGECELPAGREVLRMPEGVVRVLRRCLRRSTDERFSHMAEVAEALLQVYREEIGTAYPRTAPSPPLRAGSNGRAQRKSERSTQAGTRWDDPREWVLRALRAQGRDPKEAEDLLASCSGSRRAQAIADIAAYEEALRIYEKLSGPRRQGEMAELCVNKALVHQSVDDVPGALSLYDRAIGLYEGLLAEAAEDGSDRADWTSELGWACHSKVIALSQFGDKRAALPLCDRAIRLYEGLIEKGHADLRPELGLMYMNKANIVSELGDQQGALLWYERTITLYEGLVKEGQCELRADLARTYGNKAVALRGLGDKLQAVSLYDRAISLYEGLVKDGEHELGNELARTYTNKASAMRALGDRRGALSLYDRAIKIRERLVNEEGRHELANELARSYTNKANAVRALGDKKAALGLYDRAIEIREALVKERGRRDLVGDLARVRAYRAETLITLGCVQQARIEARAAVALLQAEMQRTGRADLQQVLKWASEALKTVL